MPHRTTMIHPTPLVACPPMWISRDAARSDVALAPGGLLVGGGLVALLHRLPIWPGGLLGAAIDLVFLVVVMIVWPLWLARQRGETHLAGSEPVRLGDLSVAVLVAAPLMVAGIASAATAPGVGIGQAIAGRLQVAGTLPIGGIQVAALFVLAAGTWLVLTLVARRAVEGYSSPDMSVAAAVRTWGLAAAGATTLLHLLASVAGGGSALRSLLLGVAVAMTVLVVDRLVPPRMSTTRMALLAPVIVVVILWLIRGFLFSSGLLANLAGASFGAGITVAVAALCAARRPTASLLLPLAAVIWLLPIIPAPV